jgi:transcriptional regulator with XRE-family HTH domain
MSDVSQIDGSAVRLRREAQGWAINDLASRACLSVKQVRQIEEGGLSSFYSENVKLTAAKKVAALLQLSEAQLFGQVPLNPPPAEEESLLYSTTVEPARMAYAEPMAATPLAASGVHLSRSEPLHFLAQPPEVDWTPPVAAPEPSHIDKPAAAQPGPIDQPPSVVTDTAQAQIEPVASGNYFLKILVLFLVAIAVAALLRPKPTEPPPSAPEAATGQSMTPPVPPIATEAPVTPVAEPIAETATAPANETKPLNAGEPSAAPAENKP